MIIKYFITTLHVLPHYTALWNITDRKQAINNKLQDSVAAYLRCDWVVNNQIKKSLLPSMPVEIFLIGEYLAKLQARRWLSRALSSSFSSVVARHYAMNDLIVRACASADVPVTK